MAGVRLDGSSVMPVLALMAWVTPVRSALRKAWASRAWPVPTRRGSVTRTASAATTAIPDMTGPAPPQPSSEGEAVPRRGVLEEVGEHGGPEGQEDDLEVESPAEL